MLDCTGFGVPFARFPTVLPAYTTIADLLCVVIFALARFNRRRWHVKNRLDQYINITMAAVAAATVIDAVQSILSWKRPLLGGLLRPIIVGCFV